MVLRSKVQLFSQKTKYLVRKVGVSESHYFLTRKFLFLISQHHQNGANGDVQRD